ncbi:MAG: carbohydrate ABC transporter permease [Actinomycetota bacterium]|nr:carbohydrate ABC transporter permease [Actinomycetota bacterium]
MSTDITSDHSHASGTEPDQTDAVELDRLLQRNRRSTRVRKLFAYGVLCLFVLIAIGPVLYIISPAFRESRSLFSYPPEWIPSDWYLGNFQFLFNDTSYLRWSLNTLIFATGVTIIALIIDTLAGYAFARFDFPGKKVLFACVLATLMVPVAALLAPTYLLVRGLEAWTFGLVGVDTFAGLILPMTVSPLGVFMMRQFIETLPKGLLEAARMDGAGELRIFLRVVLPLIKPAIVVLGIFVFMLQWANFLWPLVITTKDDTRVLTVGISTLQGQFVTNWGVIAAATLMTLVPITLVFLFFQRWFVQASIAGAIKQ